MLSSVAVHVGAALYVAYGALEVADPSTSTPSLENFLQYGVLGLVVLGFLTGWIVPGPTAKQMLGENTRLQALVEKVIPVTATYAATMEKSNAAHEKSAQAMEVMSAKLELMEKRIAELLAQREQG